jgi:transcription initiation factor IIF auxiliary subunit
MTFSIERQIIKNPQGKIKVWTPNGNGQEHFHIGIWIDGTEQELDSVDHVEYKLHPSFTKPVRTSSNRANKFSVTIWTWGMFEIDVAIYLQDGSVQRLKYYLSYELPADDGTNYIAVEA